MQEDTANTSTNEGAQDTGADLEDIEVTLDELDGSETEETEESSNDASANESGQETEEESEDDEGNQSLDEETEEEDTASEDDADARKRHNDEMARQRIADRQAKEAQRLERDRQQTEYLQNAEDARDLALRQLQVDAYNNRVESNVNKLETGLERAVATIDIFREGTPEQKKVLADSLDKFERMYVRRDPNGDPVVVEGDVYQYLVDEADSIRSLTRAGAQSEVKARNKTKSRADIVPSRTPKQSKDTDLDDFDRGWDD